MPELDPYRSPKCLESGGAPCQGNARRWIGRVCAAAAITVCTGATIATLSMEGIAIANYNPGSWESVVILGGWNCFAYLLLSTTAFAFKNSMHAASTALTGTIIVSCLSLLALYGALHVFFEPPTPGHRIMNCSGPAEIVIPFFQLPLSIVFVSAACFLNGRCIN